MQTGEGKEQTFLLVDYLLYLLTYNHPEYKHIYPKKGKDWILQIQPMSP